MSTAAKPNRAVRRKLEKQHDLGPERDPVRQQGRDERHVYKREDWFETAQTTDRSRATRRRRVYHKSYGALVEVEIPSGRKEHGPERGVRWRSADETFEQLAEIAEEFEAAGINLGWGRCSSAGGSRVRGSIEEEDLRRYHEPRPNKFFGRVVSRRGQEPAAATPGPQATPAACDGLDGLYASLDRLSARRRSKQPPQSQTSGRPAA